MNCGFEGSDAILSLAFREGNRVERGTATTPQAQPVGAQPSGYQSPRLTRLGHIAEVTQKSAGSKDGLQNPKGAG